MGTLIRADSGRVDCERIQWIMLAAKLRLNSHELLLE